MSGADIMSVVDACMTKIDSCTQKLERWTKEIENQDNNKVKSSSPDELDKTLEILKDIHGELYALTHEMRVHNRAADGIRAREEEERQDREKKDKKGKPQKK